MIKDAELNEIISQIQAQYRDTNIKELLAGIAEIIEKYAFNCMNSLEKDGLNLATARGDFLDLWAYIFNFTRYVPRDISDLEGDYFNFRNKNFLKLLFFSKESARYVGLDDIALRPLLLFQAQTFYNFAGLKNVNDFSKSMLDEYVVVNSIKDTQKMSMWLYFTKEPPAWLDFALKNFDILQRPAGVQLNIDRNDYRIIGFETNNADYNANELGSFWRSIFKIEVPKGANFFGVETLNRGYNIDKLGAFYQSIFATDSTWGDYAEQHKHELTDFRKFSFQTTNNDYNFTKISGFYLSQFNTKKE